jgi:hypothetical protein
MSTTGRYVVAVAKTAAGASERGIMRAPPASQLIASKSRCSTKGSQHSAEPL